MLTPQAAKSYGHYENNSKNYVHFTGDLDTANAYAETRSEDYGRGSPRVYRVEPTGAHESDPNSPGDFRTQSPLRVMSEEQFQPSTMSWADWQASQ